MITFRYVIDVLDDAGDAIGRITAQPDWRAAMAWVRLEGIREGRLRPVVTTGAGSVDPVWDAVAGAPYVGAFRVTIGPVVRDIPLTYLRGIVQRAQAALVTQDVLAAGAGFRWVVSAFPADAAPAAPADGFAIEEIERPLPLDEASLAARLAGAEAVDPPSASLPVFLPQRVLDEAMAVARATPDVEAGGVLVGRLHRDTDSPELFVEVTAQVPALHTRASSVTLTFTSDTWAAVHAAIALRGRNESMVGWYHSHPNWCRLRGCPLERRRHCDVAGPFFSQEDVHLHAACFGAWHIGLLISDGDVTGGMTASLYGWEQGMVVPRGFHVIGRTKGATHATHATS